MDNQENQEGNTDPRDGIAPFPDMPMFEGEDSEFKKIFSSLVPAGSLGYIRVDGELAKDPESQFNPVDKAITVDEKGKRIIANAIDLSRMGHLAINLNLLAKHPDSVLNKMKANIWIENGDLLQSDELKPPGKEWENPEILLNEFPSLTKIPEGSSYRWFASYFNDHSTTTGVMLPRVMFPKIRINLTQVGVVSKK